MPPSPTSGPMNANHDLPDETAARSSLSRATTLIVRRLLFSFSYIGGAATGSSYVASVLYQPIDWAWALLGVGGLVIAVCAAGLIGYFPAPAQNES